MHELILLNCRLRYFNSFKNRVLKRFISCSPKCSFKVPKFPEFDFNYLCDPNNFKEISANIANRKGVGQINRVCQLKTQLDKTDPAHDDYKMIQSELYKEACRIPNKTHSSVVAYQDEPKIIKHVGSKKIFNYKPIEFHEITKRLNLVRTEQLGNLAGNRSYFVLGEMAEMEQALIMYTVNLLIKNKFQLVSVPDILHRDIIESCGLNTRGERTQVYTLDPTLHGEDYCLSGTSEMALAGLFCNQVISSSALPIKVAAVSRCYRAETSSTSEEKGIYRVHQFTKVEMFAISTPEMSDDILEEFRTLEEESFGALGLHLRTLDMPPHELGAPAYRKYDVEAWLPGRNIFGEISSCSNCTDYQSRRLGIQYQSNDGLRYVHTLNGTACAIPRMLIALTETFQTNKGNVEIPEVLQKYMNNKEYIGRQKKVPELRLVKNKKQAA